IGDEAADRARRIGAVDGVFALAEQQRGGAHRVMRRTARNQPRDRRLVADDFRWRRPGWGKAHAADEGGAGPLLAGAADADRVADRPAATEHVIEPPLAGLDDDGAGGAF